MEMRDHVIHPISSRASSDDELELDDDAVIAKDDGCNPGPCPTGVIDCSAISSPPLQHTQMPERVVIPPKVVDNTLIPLSQDGEEIVKSVVSGSIPSYSPESKLGDYRRAAAIRREVVQRTMGRSLEGSPTEGFNYKSILGQCCEMPIGTCRSEIPMGVGRSIVAGWG